MNEIDELDNQLDSGAWYLKEADRLLKQYREAKTEHARQKILPGLVSISGKLSFQKREINKYIPPEVLDEMNLN